MKRTILFGLIFIVALALVSLLLPSKISIAKSISLNQDDGCAMSVVSDFDQWQKWFPALKDSVSSMTKLSPDEAEIINSRGHVAHIRFISKAADAVAFEIVSGDSDPVLFHFSADKLQSGGQRLGLIVNVKLDWYPWNRLKGIFLDKMAGPQYEEALENIRRACGG